MTLQPCRAIVVEFLEKYYQCADIEIRGLVSSDDDDEPANNRKEPSPSSFPRTSTVPTPATDLLPASALLQLHTPISNKDYDHSKLTECGAVSDVIQISAGPRNGRVHKQ